jgi:hypothetical protein
VESVFHCECVSATLLSLWMIQMPKSHGSYEVLGALEVVNRGNEKSKEGQQTVCASESSLFM